MNVIIPIFPIEELRFTEGIKCAYDHKEPGSVFTEYAALLITCVVLGWGYGDDENPASALGDKWKAADVSNEL